MIHTQMERVVASVPVAVGASAVTLTVDTIGYDQVSFVAVRAANAATVFASVLRVDQSNNNSTFVAAPGFVGGTDFVIAAVSDTNSASIYKLDVDTKTLQRYLRLTVTPSVSVNVVSSARLSRGENAPVTAAEAGCIGLVVG